MPTRIFAGVGDLFIRSHKITNFSLYLSVAIDSIVFYEYNLTKDICDAFSNRYSVTMCPDIAKSCFG